MTPTGNGADNAAFLAENARGNPLSWEEARKYGREISELI
jgi:hypothetical protein